MNTSCHLLYFLWTPTHEIYFACSNIQQNIISRWLIYNAQSILQIYMLCLKVLCIFRTRIQDKNKNGPSDPTSKTVSGLLRRSSLTDQYSQDRTIILYFKGPYKTSSTRQSAGSSLENYAQIPKILFIDVYFYLRMLVTNCYWSQSISF